MKKLILIFSLLLSSLNLSADQLLRDNSEVTRMAKSQEQQAQESYDTYATFLTFNEQQNIDNPTGSRVSEELMSDAKLVAIIDAVQFAISETFQAAIARDETITTVDNILPGDVENGIKAAESQVIKNNIERSRFSVADLKLISEIVNSYVTSIHNYRVENNYPMLDDDDRFLYIADRIGGYLLMYRMVLDGDDPRTNVNDAERFTRNIATFFTNQNAVQSTCPGGGSCAKPLN